MSPYHKCHFISPFTYFFCFTLNGFSGCKIHVCASLQLPGGFYCLLLIISSPMSLILQKGTHTDSKATDQRLNIFCRKLIFPHAVDWLLPNVEHIIKMFNIMLLFFHLCHIDIESNKCWIAVAALKCRHGGLRYWFSVFQTPRHQFLHIL